ncbi:TniB family NTP-binding protein [Bosea sp. BK604]|uniref:TniB family NTP-binding protein n=1 Tax=Bosea sp. BK604 TaxID=2512180 RepID=UPI001051DFB2|nr:TniB family NTP-binding protein [Bosea sp. BK604]TCR68176.1 TniB protein [Bosea sp. BK604]
MLVEEASERLLQLDKVFIMHPAYRSVMESICFKLEVRKNLSEKPNFFVSGPSGIGKSTLRKHLISKYPIRRNARTIELPIGGKAVCDEIPVIAVSLKGQPTVIAMIRQMLSKIGDPLFKKKEGKEDLEERLFHLLKVCGVRMVIVDEAQLIVDRDGIVRRFEIAEALKDLSERAQVSVCLLGMGRTRVIFEHDSQIARRWDEEIQLQPYDWGAIDEEDANVESRLNFLALLTVYRANMPVPLADEIDVEDRRTAMKFFYVSRGIIGLLKKLILEATEIACRANRSRIDNATLSEAFCRAFIKERRRDGLGNPFSSGWIEQLPPPLPDHSQLLLPSKGRRSSRNDRRRAANGALTKV